MINQSAPHFPLLKDKVILICFSLFVLAYAVVLLISPRIGPIDEFVFLSTLQVGRALPVYGRDFPFYDDFLWGRFVPVGGQEYNLVALISATPAAYYLFNAIQLVGVVLLYYRCLRVATQDRRLILAAMTLLLLTPAFATCWSCLLSGEKGATFYLVIFLFCHLRVQQTGSILAAVAALISANLALYYKEPVFLAIGGYAAGNLVLGWKDSSRRTRLVNGLVLLSCLTYLVFYAVLILPHRGEASYGWSPLPSGVKLLKNAFSYAAFSDPVVLLLAFPLAMWRVIRIVRHGEKGHPVFDPLLLGGCLYAGAFFVLNLYSPYYFLPAYIFIIPPLLHFFLTTSLPDRIGWRVLATLAALVMVFNSIPTALHALSFNKHLPLNYGKTIDFLAADIRARDEGHRRRIFVDGVPRSRDKDVFFVYGEFLQYKGLRLSEFDLESRMVSDRPSGVVYLRDRYLAPYGAYGPGPAPEPKSGDYVVVSPDSLLDVTPAYLRGLESDHRLVFATRSPWGIPRLDLKSVARRLLKGWLSEETKRRYGLILTDYPSPRTDFFVYVRK